MCSSNRPSHESKSFASLFAATSSSPIPVKEPLSRRGEHAIFLSTEEIQKLSNPFQYALVGKFSRGRPSMVDIRKFFSLLDLKAQVMVGLLDYRHILIRCSMEADFLRLWSRNIWFVQKAPMRVFRWTHEFHVDHESPLTPVWVSLPKLPVHLFGKEMIFSIVSALGRPLLIDAATASLTRPSVARVLVEIDLTKSLPSRAWIGYGESKGFWQELCPENLPRYCSTCFHVGHPDDECRLNIAQAAPVAIARQEKLEQKRQEQVFNHKEITDAPLLEKDNNSRYSSMRDVQRKDKLSMVEEQLGDKQQNHKLSEKMSKFQEISSSKQRFRPKRIAAKLNRNTPENSIVISNSDLEGIAATTSKQLENPWYATGEHSNNEQPQELSRAGNELSANKEQPQDSRRAAIESKLGEGPSREKMQNTAVTSDKLEHVLGKYSEISMSNGQLLITEGESGPFVMDQLGQNQEGSNTCDGGANCTENGGQLSEKHTEQWNNGQPLQLSCEQSAHDKVEDFKNTPLNLMLSPLTLKDKEQMQNIMEPDQEVYKQKEMETDKVEGQDKVVVEGQDREDLSKNKRSFPSKTRKAGNGCSRVGEMGPSSHFRENKSNAHLGGAKSEQKHLDEYIICLPKPTTSNKSMCSVECSMENSLTNQKEVECFNNNPLKVMLAPIKIMQPPILDKAHANMALKCLNSENLHGNENGIEFGEPDAALPDEDQSPPLTEQQKELLPLNNQEDQIENNNRHENEVHVLPREDDTCAREDWEKMGQNQVGAPLLNTKPSCTKENSDKVGLKGCFHVGQEKQLFLIMQKNKDQDIIPEKGRMITEMSPSVLLSSDNTHKIMEPLVDTYNQCKELSERMARLSYMHKKPL